MSVDGPRMSGRSGSGLSPTRSVRRMNRRSHPERRDQGDTPASASRGGGSGSRRGPTPLSEVLGALFAAKGYGRLRSTRELEEAWAEAVGPSAARQTCPGLIRHGVLSVTVSHPTLLEELAAFRKPTLLSALRRALPDTKIHDIRFRIGPISPSPSGFGSSSGPSNPAKDRG